MLDAPAAAVLSGAVASSSLSSLTTVGTFTGVCTAHTECLSFSR